MIKYDARTRHHEELRSLFSHEEQAVTQLERIRVRISQASAAYSRAMGHRGILPKAEIKREVGA